MKLLKVSAFAVFAFLGLISNANASLIFGDDGTNVSITLTEDISFTALAGVAGTGSDSFVRFVFEDVFSIPPFIDFFGTLSNTIGLAVNGVLVSPITDSLWGSFSGVLQEIDENDFTISFRDFGSFTAGDTITLKAGTAVTNMQLVLTPDLPASGVTMVNNGGTAISGLVSIDNTNPPNGIPEPGVLSLILLGLLGLKRARK